MTEQDRTYRRRPSRRVTIELLEERVTLSRSSLVPPLALSASTGRAITIGVLGDSYSDEYAFYPPDRSQARNWVEILAATRGVNFGPFSTISRGTPRDQGFADDWALSGTDSAGMDFWEVPGLVAQMAQGDVQYVSLYIGANDFYTVVERVLPL